MEKELSEFGLETAAKLGAVYAEIQVYGILREIEITIFHEGNPFENEKTLNN